MARHAGDVTPAARFARGLTPGQARDVCAVGAGFLAAALAFSLVHALFLDRARLPDLESFMQFEFPTVGPIYDLHGSPLIEFGARRSLTTYADLPPVVEDAILAAEDKRFFSHIGLDYMSLVRVATKIRVGPSGGFPQGGSTITQQLVRGVFLADLMGEERRGQLLSDAWTARALSWVVGVHAVNQLLRKAEEIRLSIWLEEEMASRFGSKRRAKEELLARYASFVYMGSGQYGFARAAAHYFDRPLSTLTTADPDLAALLAGIMKAPRDYAPTARNEVAARRRRDQILTLMARSGALSVSDAAAARARPLVPLTPRAPETLSASAVVQHALDEFRQRYTGLSVDDLMQGRIHVHSTVDARIQRLVVLALEHGLKRYEARYPAAAGIVQGSVVVLKNGDGSVLAETGGRQVFRGRDTSYRDFNRVRESLRQPGSAMKPIVYLAAFRQGAFTLDTLVPDEPISVPDGRPGQWKAISNYDGQFKGWMPLRTALAESRNAVAIWLTTQIGIDTVRKAAQSLGVQTELKRYPTTALGASEVNLLELATAYRALASGVVVPPHVIRRVVTRAGVEVVPDGPRPLPVAISDRALELVQEGLRGVVRLPTGTAHGLASRAFPIPVMGKTGTTNEFKDAIFVGSTYGPDGITIAVRIGFDDNRSLGPKETGGRVAMPVFEELMRELYGQRLVGAAPAFPTQMERRITLSLISVPSETARLSASR